MQIVYVGGRNAHVDDLAWAQVATVGDENLAIDLGRVATAACDRDLLLDVVDDDRFDASHALLEALG